jgi:hypothetical protein
VRRLPKKKPEEFKNRSSETELINLIKNEHNKISFIDVFLIVISIDTPLVLIETPGFLNLINIMNATLWLVMGSISNSFDYIYFCRFIVIVIKLELE